MAETKTLAELREESLEARKPKDGGQPCSECGCQHREKNGDCRHCHKPRR
jgi:hypothetical protein